MQEFPLCSLKFFGLILSVISFGFKDAIEKIRICANAVLTICHFGVVERASTLFLARLTFFIQMRVAFNAALF